MCRKAVDEDTEAVKFVQDWYKTQEICNHARHVYPCLAIRPGTSQDPGKARQSSMYQSILPYLSQFVPDHHTIQQMCNEAVHKVGVRQYIGKVFPNVLENVSYWI